MLRLTVPLIWIAVAVIPFLVPQQGHSYLLTTTAPGNLMFEYLGGEAGPSHLEFGIGTPSVSSSLEDRDVVFKIDYWTRITSPQTIVNKGYYQSGSQFDFYNISDYNGNLYAFSGGLLTSPSLADLAVFTDTDNSLHWGGSVVEIIGFNQWIFHLDDAWSYLYDDDDNEMLIKVWVDTSAAAPMLPVPEPSTVLLVSFGLILLGVRINPHRSPGQ